jgi:hypothetical protein
MDNQLIHQSVFNPADVRLTPRARLPEALEWDAQKLNSRIEHDPYVSAETLINKLTSGSWSDIDRSVLATLTSSG